MSLVNDRLMECQTEEEYYQFIEELQKKYDNGYKLEGEEAALLMCDWAGDCTHGNYDGNTIFSRMGASDFNITLQKKG